MPYWLLSGPAPHQHCLPCSQDLVRRTWARGRNDEFLARALKYAQRRKWPALLKAFHAAVAKVGSPGLRFCSASANARTQPTVGAAASPCFQSGKVFLLLGLPVHETTFMASILLKQMPASMCCSRCARS